MKKVLLPACVVVLAGLAVAAGGQSTDDDGFERISQQGRQQIDRINEALWQGGRVCVGVAALLAVVVVVWIISPGRIADGVNERILRRAVRDVDELLKRIEKEAEATTEDSASQSEAADAGILAGMTEVAEFEQAKQVPSYVLTVNDLMLDNIRVTLKKLRGHSEGDAQRYRDYMFSVLDGIKAITEQSAEAGVPSPLAVDVRGYFKDERRYRDWRKLLGRYARKGKHRELAHTFVLFMKALKEGRPQAVGGAADGERGFPPSDRVSPKSEVPHLLNEETLQTIQKAAAQEARDLMTQIRNPKSEVPNREHAWQFEFVRGQQQMHSREEAQRMLSVFLSSERKFLLEITKVRMLPCRAWGHVLHMLGAESGELLQKRIEDRLLTIQEIVILEKAFLQTLAKRESLARIYGQGEKAALMMDMHVPEIRRETLALLRKLRQVDPKRADQATETLNEEETPQNDQVRRLIEHYVHHGHNPPGAG